MKILVVEDNPVNAEIIRLTLEQEGFEPLVAGHGQEALGYLEAQPDIGLVITDVMMPGMDGLEMLGVLRQRSEWRLLPVVIATSLANQGTVRQAAALHCRHFIVKPFTVPLLVQTVRDAIGQRGVVLQDKAIVIGRIGLDAAGYARLTVAFATFVSQQVGALQQLCERGEHAEIDATLDRDLFALEESAALLGAERLRNLLAAFGLPGSTIAADMIGGLYKALLAELRLLQHALPALPKPKRFGHSPPAANPGPAPAA